MNDERYLKLKCLQLSGGDIDRAGEMFAWLWAEGEPTVDEYRIYELWGVLDDIDTYSDIAKDDDAMFRSLVEKAHKRRFEILSGVDWDTLRERCFDRSEGGGLTREQEAIAALTPAPEETEQAALEIAVAAHMAEHPQTQESAAEVEIPEGFTKWEGGERPVPVGARVEICTRTSLGPKGIRWTVTEAVPRWSVSDAYDDIIAYRIIEASNQAELVALLGSDLHPVPGAGEESRDQPETTESEPDPVLRAFEDDQIIAPAPAWIDEQTCEPINPHVEAEGYAPVVAEDEPEPGLLDRFNPFRVKADA